MNETKFVPRPANLGQSQVTESVAFPTIPINLEHHKAVRETYATLDQLEVLSEVIDLDEDMTEYVPERDQPREQPVNTQAELIEIVNKLRQQIQFLQGSSDQLEVDRVLLSLSEQPLEQAFNNAQRLYTLPFLEELDSPFAAMLANNLDQFFRAQGKVNPTWAHFVSSTLPST